MSSKGKNTTEIIKDKQNILDVYLAEWAMHVPDQQASQARQGQILSLTVTEVFVLLGFVGAVAELASLESTVIAALNCIIIPGVFMLTGGLWIDCVYRMMSLAAYLFEIETKVSEILDLKGDDIIGREHHISRLGKGIPFVFRANHWYYYICMAFYIFFPWATVAFHCFVLNKTWYTWCNITFVLYALFMLFMIAYCGAIYKVKSGMNH